MDDLDDLLVKSEARLGCPRRRFKRRAHTERKTY